LALSGRSERALRCLLLEEKRTCLIGSLMSAFDPKRTRRRRSGQRRAAI
jgi:hypothetical protein